MRIKDKASQFVNKSAKDIQRQIEPLSEDNWYRNAARSCEVVSDSLLRQKTGVSARIIKGAASKLGFIGTSTGIFSVASMLGTASTGTAIGSLSGAAFTSAALAWVGGSVLMGSIIVAVAASAGGLGALLGAGWVSRKYLWGKKRDRTELEQQEQRVLDVCLSLAMAFREQEKVGRVLDPTSARYLYGDALKPLCEELLEIKYQAESWPLMARRRLESAIGKLRGVAGFLHNWSKSHPNATVGIVSAVLLQLMSDEIPDFNERELLVLDALRRSNNSLTDASHEDLAAYVQDLSPDQIAGMSSNVKGIFHELLYQRQENTDGDDYVVEIFEATNHAGSDVRIINTVTGEVKEAQLKATKYLSYIKEHNERYENIEVFATQEVADLDPNIESTGFINAELDESVATVFDGLSETENTSALESMSVAALVTLARNSRVLLKSRNISRNEREKMVKDGMISAGVAGVVHLII